MLVQHLREMERDGLVTRTDMSDKLRHVEYSLKRPLGLATVRLLNALVQWTANYQLAELRRDDAEMRKALWWKHCESTSAHTLAFCLPLSQLSDDSRSSWADHLRRVVPDAPLAFNYCGVFVGAAGAADFVPEFEVLAPEPFDVLGEVVEGLTDTESVK